MSGVLTGLCLCMSPNSPYETTLTKDSYASSQFQKSINKKGMPRGLLPLRLGLTHPPSNKRG